jgi:Cytochrome P450
LVLAVVRACLDETLRLFTPIPTSLKESIRPCVFPVFGVDAQGNRGPIYMPGPGVPLFSSRFAIHRRKDLWGEDAEDFVPERWIDPDRVKDLAADPSKFIPFNGGPRLCPGQVCGCAYVWLILS